jgi:arginyl-tRNA synthetase
MQEIAEVVKQASKALFDANVEPEITRPEEQFGDYSTNVAMQLAAKLKRNPREIAVALASKLHGQEGIAEVNIAGPGFINLKLTDHALLKLVERQPAQTLSGKTIVAEYSDPNPFKVLHAGHLYTTLVGDAIANLIENAGGKLHRLNYGGDVGLHVGRAMWAIVKELGGENPQKLTEIGEQNRLDWISQQYVKGNKAYENDSVAKAEIIETNKKVYQLHAEQDHDSPFAQIYWTCRQWSYEGFDRLYKQLKIHSFEKYIAESETTPTGVGMVQKGLEQGVFEKSDGAVVFKGEEKGLHTRVFLNSEGLPTYEAKDLGLAATKWQDYHFDLNIIITANDIVEYMKVVLAALAHFYPEVSERTKHLTHGIIKLPGGVKMSSRLGNILRASDILEAAQQANKKTNGKNDEDIVLAAVKYAFLKSRVGGDIIYDPEESVALEGNSGPYLQYAHARAKNILNKAGDGSPLSADHSPFDEHERSLVRKMGEYAETVEKATRELLPHHIATYLYELAQVFNRFYENSRVIGDEREAVRIDLVSKYADILKAGLSILGISAPEKM